MVPPIGCAGVKKAWFHVDMDGLDAIYQAQGKDYSGSRDRFYISALENSLEFFAREGITATYFLIARDLDDPHKRSAINQVVSGSHRIACHSLNHRYLNRISAAAKRLEIVDAKMKIEDSLGVPVQGFRAPGYSIDMESLEILRHAGYRYDSSIFPSHAFRKRLGIQRLFPEPFKLFPEHDFFEFPLPYVGPGLPPFHPCYAFYLTHYYFNSCLNAFKKRHNYLTLLFHLTDFADRQRLHGGVRLNLFTNNYYSSAFKLSFLQGLIRKIRRDFGFTTSEELLSNWPTSAPDLDATTVLGVSTTHETGACVVRDGAVLAAVNEERLSRTKLDNRYPPTSSIREVIRLAGIPPREIGAVAIAGLSWWDLIPQSLESLRHDVTDFHAINDYFPHFCRVLYRLFYFWRALGYQRVLKFLKEEYGISPKVYFVEHHEAHAASAYRTGVPQAGTLIVTADGVGDEVCVTISKGNGSTIRRLGTSFYPHSFGQFYTACTQVLGFKAGRHEGKITGLSGYGRPNEELIGKLEKTFFSGDRFRLNKKYYSEGFLRLRFRDLFRLFRGELSMLDVEYRNYKAPLRRLLKGYPREEIAYAFQYVLERELTEIVGRYLDHEARHLALAGGVFANVKLNMALSRKLQPESLYIFPNMGDGGLCVGAALSIAAAKSVPARDMYLGTEYSEDEVLSAIGEHPSLAHFRPKDLAGRVADELARHKIVARFDGRMEFGPRALGNRSILYHCGDPSVNAWLNQQLRRTEFMPFAPICLYEDADEFFHIRDGERRPCEFMTLVVPCTQKMKQLCPAAVHVDGTARPQLIRREINPGMHDILAEYKKRTGLSCLINTSFNMHEEPIVRSPAEAISAFLQSNLDLLVLGAFLVQRTGAAHAESTSTQGLSQVRGSDSDTSAEPSGCLEFDPSTF